MKRSLLTIFIVLSVFGFTSFNAALAIKASLNEDSNIDYIVNLLYQCEPFQTNDSENMIILRIDDIQAFAWRDISIKMIDEAFGRNMPVVLGIIPKGLEEDKKILNYLKRNSCNIEIAQHGWENIDDPYAPEFGDLTEEEAYKRIIKGKAVLEKITDEPIITFIPPNNIYSAGTAIALEKTGFKIISSEGNEYFDYTATTYDFDVDSLTPVTEIINQCQKGLDKNNLCIIMIHPQDYAVEGKLDSEKYKNYLELLDELKKLNAGFVKMKDV